jgi:small subunit ribosomal protein S1
VILSRREAQAECRSYYLSSLVPGDIIPATVTHLDSFGAFLDVGCGVPSLLSIDCISVSRISHPADRLSNGQRLYVAVKLNDTESGRIYVTLKELLGTWEENACNLGAGQTVSGIVRSVESYGIFVELSPNLAGLAEHRADNPIISNIQAGDRVSVFIKSIIPDKMKIKLVLIDAGEKSNERTPLSLFIDPSNTSRIERWRYSPANCQKIIETVFD